MAEMLTGNTPTINVGQFSLDRFASMSIAAQRVAAPALYNNIMLGQTVADECAPLFQCYHDAYPA